jgi:hypothetical protein
LTDTEIMVKDALGNKIQIGKLYGYAKRDNGFRTVYFGHAIKVNEDTRKVTLGVTLYRDWRFEDLISPEKAKKVSLLGGTLIPATLE